MVMRLTPEESRTALQNEEPPKLLDVRTPEEFAHAHIEGSLFIPMNEMASRMHELDPDDKWIVVCHHGYRSMQVAMWLESRGFEWVANLEGGIDRWRLEVDTQVPRY